MECGLVGGGGCGLWVSWRGGCGVRFSWRGRVWIVG